MFDVPLYNPSFPSSGPNEARCRNWKGSLKVLRCISNSWSYSLVLFLWLIKSPFASHGKFDLLGRTEQMYLKAKLTGGIAAENAGIKSSFAIVSVKCHDIQVVGIHISWVWFQLTYYKLKSAWWERKTFMSKGVETDSPPTGPRALIPLSHPQVVNNSDGMKRTHLWDVSHCRADASLEKTVRQAQLTQSYYVICYSVIVVTPIPWHTIKHFLWKCQD